MQAVILAAGRGTRMGHATEHTPKPLLEVLGKTLLEYKFDALPDAVDEIIIVVGYLGDMIRNRFGSFYKDKKLTYVEQTKLDGTAGALWQAKPLLSGRFLVMHGDDIFLKEDIQKCLQHEWSVLVQHVEHTTVAAVTVDENNRVLDVEEDAAHRKAGLANAGVYGLDMRVFECTPIKISGKEEFGLPQTLVKGNVPLYAVPAEFWILINTLEDLKKAEEILTELKK